MLKFFLIITMSLTLLQATSTNSCEAELNNMIKHYHAGEKAMLTNNYKVAKKNFKQCIQFSYNSLVSCQDIPTYSFEISQNHIIQSNNKLDKIYQIEIQ